MPSLPVTTLIQVCIVSNNGYIDNFHLVTSITNNIFSNDNYESIIINDIMIFFNLFITVSFTFKS